VGVRLQLDASGEGGIMEGCVSERTKWEEGGCRIGDYLEEFGKVKVAWERKGS